MISPHAVGAADNPDTNVNLPGNLAPLPPSSPPKAVKQSRLLPWTVGGIVLTGVLSYFVLAIFVRLIAGQDSWWKIGDHKLGDGQWFEAARVTVAVVALTVAGGAAYLAYRRQRTAEENQKTAAETQLITARAYQLSTKQHSAALRRELRARFTDAATQLAHPAAAVRIAGVYAMAALADDWHTAREPSEVQTCIDVLCGYLRLPYEPERAESHQTKRIVTRPRTNPDGTTANGEIEEHFEYQQNDREVRKTIVRVVKDHLKPESGSSWSERAFDFQGALLEDLDFSSAIFRGPVSFRAAQFHGMRTTFGRTQFHGNQTSFAAAQFHGNQTSFAAAEFRSDQTSFAAVEFRSDRTSFAEAQFHGNQTLFLESKFHSMRTTFSKAQFRSRRTSFSKAEFYGDQTSFADAQFHGERTSYIATQFHSPRMLFGRAQFHSQLTTFRNAKFRSDRTSFAATQFHSDKTSFSRAQFQGERTSFRNAEFHGRQTSFQSPDAWHHVYFDWDPKPPYAPAVEKPDSVLPKIWPPTIQVP